MALVGIVIGSIGIGALLVGTGKVAIIFSKKTIKVLKQKQLKKQLEIELRNNISTLNYNEFLNTIYKIKNYDEHYNKYLYVKMKKLLFFNDNHTESFNSFNRRFNSSYNDEEEHIIELIKREISLSYSQNHSVLDL